jgi:peptidoglycan/LPS O-acetylase OafA/YrhL
VQGDQTHEKDSCHGHASAAPHVEAEGSFVVDPGTSKRAARIHPLTSLRFFAALMVVLYHTLPSGTPGFSPSGFLGQSRSIWFASVSFFFFLSGYILAVVYLRGDKLLDRRKFWAARFARVYPLFFVTLVLATPSELVPHIATYGFSKGSFMTFRIFCIQAVMLQAWIPQLRHPIDFPNWSLSVETLFYLTFPFLGSLLWKLRGARIWVAALLIYVVNLVAVRTVAPMLGGDYSVFFPLLHLATFMLGILLARWQERTINPSHVPPVQHWQVYAALLIAIAGYVGVVGNLSHIPKEYVADGLLTPVFACIIWGFSSTDTRIARLFSLSWLVILGDASYGLYLIHIPVWEEIFVRLHAQEKPIMYLLYLGTCIGLSVLSFYFMEAPTRKWLLRRLAVVPRETLEEASDAQ